MNLNFTSPLHPASSQRPTSFFIEDILLHKPKPLREVAPDHFASSLASRVPLLDYGYPLMPTPTLLTPHAHHPLHKGDHHHPYFLTTSGKYQKPPGVGRDTGSWVLFILFCFSTAPRDQIWQGGLPSSATVEGWGLV